MENKPNSTKINNFSSLKKTTIKLKRQTTVWKKNFAAHIANKSLVSSIYT